MKKPLIGITAGEIVNRDYPWLPVTYGQRHPFVDAVIDGGAIPIILPLSKNNEVLDQISELLDGLLLSGGNDIDPKMYGGDPNKKTMDPSPLRDQVESQYLKNALEKDIPVLGLCRGMQFINVYLGGNLYQDLPEDVPGSLDHESSAHDEDLTKKAHPVDIDTDSKLFKIVGEKTLDVNTLHHQSVNKLGKGLRATGHSQDGVIEAIESTDGRFIIGIQAHPESLNEVVPEWSVLFKAFAEAAADAKTKKPSSRQSSA